MDGEAGDRPCARVAEFDPWWPEEPVPAAQSPNAPRCAPCRWRSRPLA
jgi:hypothetical protein